MRRRGFTLVEAVVAFLVLFIAVVVSFSVISSVKRGEGLTERRDHAALLAHSVLSEVRALGFSNIATRTGSLSSADTRAGVQSVQQYTYSVDVESLATDTKRVRATVRWTESNGQKQVILQTLVVDL